MVVIFPGLKYTIGRIIIKGPLGVYFFAHHHHFLLKVTVRRRDGIAWYYNRSLYIFVIYCGRNKLHHGLDSYIFNLFVLCNLS